MVRGEPTFTIVPPVATRGELEKAVQERISEIQKKKLVDRAIVACNHFFGECGRPLNIRGVEFLHHEWEQGSDYTKLDFEVRVPLDDEGKRQMFMRHRCGHWQPDQVEVRIAAEVVFRVVPARDADGESKALQLSDGLVCECYISGDWEDLLDGKKLEARAKGYIARGEELQKELEEQQKDATRKKELVRPLNGREKELAQKFGIPVS